MSWLELTGSGGSQAVSSGAESSKFERVEGSQKQRFSLTIPRVLRPTLRWASSRLARI
jgi:hypothetical protein